MLCKSVYCFDNPVDVVFYFFYEWNDIFFFPIKKIFVISGLSHRK
ncbi:MAG: hypothetical protein SOV24_08085 [Muribaculaceae bacterium]|nr:hypothetical protein [Bacteroidales bacterium]MDY2734301.1 hypothetical protein [Muribaculaceae bacterium]